MSPSPERSYIIVGAGVFGISTALHLIKKYPAASVTVIDRDAFDAESRVAASWDWNKVVRADYDDLVYCRLGLEAQDVFKSDPLWKPFFHETGIFWTCRSDYATDVIANYGKLGRKADLKAVPIAEAKKMYDGVFDDADYAGVKEVLINKTSGWAAAGDCLIAVTRECLRLGVKFVVGEVSSLQLSGDGRRCTGVKITEGKTLSADRIILSTGAYTAKLLEMTAVATGKNNLRADGRIVAGGITTGMVKLKDDGYRKFQSMPVGVQGYTPVLGPFIGSLPPTPRGHGGVIGEGGELKWWSQTIFQNNRPLDSESRSSPVLSMPPPKPDYAQWNVSRPLQQGIEHAAKVFYGKQADDWKFEKFRICWDAFTTTGDFIISPHSAASVKDGNGYDGLFVATCGNFHGWKFFPVIGKYIVQMIEGSLERELQQKWAWDRPRPGPEQTICEGGTNPDWPRWEMNDFADSTARL